MALHNRDYMGGAAPPPGSRTGGFASPWRAYRILIALNVIVFLIGKTAVGETFLLQHALVTSEAIGSGRVWSLILGGFFHLDVVHLGLAAGLLYMVGWRVEQEHGPKVLVALYLLGSLAVGLASLAVNTNPKAGTAPLPWAEPVSTGSGFVIAPGLAITNAHVVGDAETLEIQLDDGTSLPARVRARDKVLDLALLEVKIDRPVLPLAETRPPVGQAVFALGYGSLGGDTKTQLMTKALVSGFRAEKHWLVFDGKVNPGNSGGPLVDGAGRWVGVVVAKTRTTASEDSLGFAIEGNSVRAWLANQGVQVEVSSTKPPKGEAPPPTGLGRSVTRLVVKGHGGTQTSLQGEFQRIRLDPWVYGASGGFLALAGFLCMADPRRDILIFGNPVPFLVVIGFAAVADMAGALRWYHNAYSWGHLYHLTAVIVGAISLKVYRGKIQAWLAAADERRRRARLIVHKGGGGESSPPEPNETKLSLADRARLDRVLTKVGRSGLDSLSEEERAFLDHASSALRGD